MLNINWFHRKGKQPRPTQDNVTGRAMTIPYTHTSTSVGILFRLFHNIWGNPIVKFEIVQGLLHSSKCSMLQGNIETQYM